MGFSASLLLLVLVATLTEVTAENTTDSDLPEHYTARTTYQTWDKHDHVLAPNTRNRDLSRVTCLPIFWFLLSTFKSFKLHACLVFPIGPRILFTVSEELESLLRICKSFVRRYRHKALPRRVWDAFNCLIRSTSILHHVRPSYF